MARWSVNVIMSLALHRRGGFTISAEVKQRQYKRQIDNIVFTIVVEEADKSKETAQTKIKKLIESGCDRIVLEQRRRASIKTASA